MIIDPPSTLSPILAILSCNDKMAIGKNKNKILSHASRDFDESKPVVAFDLDGTIAEDWKDHYDEYDPTKIPPPFEDVSEVMERLSNYYTIMVYTCRDDIFYVKQWLDEHSIYFDHINCNPGQPDTVSPFKVYADIYVDDRSLFMPDEIDWELIEKKLIEVFYKKYY